MTTAQRVEAILRVSRASRNSDIELWLIYAQKAGMALNERQKQILRDMPTFETIIRVRRKLQEQGKYEADHSVNEARYEKFKVMRGDSESILREQGYNILPYGQ